VPSRHAAAKLTDAAAHGLVEAVAQSGTVALLDCRLPGQVRAENLAALERFKANAAPFFAAIRDGAEAYGEFLRTELNALAGGAAPPSVMALAQAAVDAHANCQLAQHILGHATGDLETLKPTKQASRRLEITQLQRTAMGLDVAFTDLVRRATEAARDAGKARLGSPTQELLTRIGVEAQPRPPFSPPGGVGLGPPSSSTPIPPKESE
jgi:hypothetical protein